MVRKFFSRVAVVGALLLLMGCSGTDRDLGMLEVASRSLLPADPELAEIYTRSCRSCHTIAATGAPLTGDSAGWKQRIDKGLDVLLESVISGSGGMPPFGMCMECDAVQFEDLILFMASSGEGTP